MKYIIHSYIKRRWYVNEFLLPSLLSQNIDRDNIEVWEDDGTLGNLYSFVKSMEYVAKCYPNNDAIWHLQDDIIISKNFEQITREANKNYIHCGFTSRIADGENSKKIGWQPVKHIWCSFQCVQIPNRYCGHFVEWFDEKVNKGRLFNAEKCDDAYFLWFMKHEYKDDLVFNIAPNIVNHVDEIVGDSVCHPQSVGKNISRYWYEKDAINDLKKEIEQYKKGNKCDLN